MTLEKHSYYECNDLDISRAHCCIDVEIGVLIRYVTELYWSYNCTDKYIHINSNQIWQSSAYDAWTVKLETQSYYYTYDVKLANLHAAGSIIGL